MVLVHLLVVPIQEALEVEVVVVDFLLEVMVQVELWVAEWGQVLVGIVVVEDLHVQHLGYLVGVQLALVLQGMQVLAVQVEA
jgi:hypothetical protein